MSTKPGQVHEKKRLSSIVLLTLLQNLHDVMALVLKKDLNLVPKEGAPKPARLMYHAICLLTRYLAKEDMRDFVALWGAQLHYKDKDFREEVRRILNSTKSGIRAELSRQFMSLESGSAEQLNEAFDRCKAALKLKDGIDPLALANFSTMPTRVLGM